MILTRAHIEAIKNQLSFGWGKWQLGFDADGEFQNVLKSHERLRTRVEELEKALSGLSFDNRCWCVWPEEPITTGAVHTAACRQAFRALHQGEMKGKL